VIKLPVSVRVLPTPTVASVTDVNVVSSDFQVAVRASAVGVPTTAMTSVAVCSVVTTLAALTANGMMEVLTIHQTAYFCNSMVCVSL
jgi:hypothetical protein